MTLLQAIILGIVQGLTEFFPISSSAHLQLTRSLLKISQPSVLFDLACHVGTLSALFLYLRREIFALLNDRPRLASLCMALLPLIPAYFLLKPLRDWAGEAHRLGYWLLLTAGLLFSGEWFRLSLKKNSLRDALVIGTMQAVALIPGISRSASTITAGRIIGLTTADAVRFSFLLSLPTILGGVCLESAKGYKELTFSGALPCLAGGLMAFIVGSLAIRFAMSWLENGNFRPFAYYCFFLGLILCICR